MEKTLAMRLLEGKKVTYEVIPYPEAMRDAAEIAAALEVPPGQLFKTLVILPPEGQPRAKPLLVMVPADRQLDLKKLAKAVGAKKVKMATHEQAEQMTGLQVGGISALALVQRPFTFLLDQSARHYEHIYVSAGQRGLDIKLPVAALIKLTQARLIDTTI
ncbi:MAG: aminoacyl-tRNA deacylase [Chloroflexota bacterium]|jgi:Cys-tRNA(Pro)/Cys-tRNA(Cys) deacylase